MSTLGRLSLLGSTLVLVLVCSGGAQQPVPAVRHIPAATVSAAFEKGGTLLARDGRNYAISAGHRDAGGEAELHKFDADIFYVLQGTAMFVTGGAMVEPRQTSPEEVRGASIQGGDRRALAKGDVIVVPAGVPHWFSQVSGRFDYFVVKVR